MLFSCNIESWKGLGIRLGKLRLTLVCISIAIEKIISLLFTETYDAHSSQVVDILVYIGNLVLGKLKNCQLEYFPNKLQEKNRTATIAVLKPYISEETDGQYIYHSNDIIGKFGGELIKNLVIWSAAFFITSQLKFLTCIYYMHAPPSI